MRNHETYRESAARRKTKVSETVGSHTVEAIDWIDISQNDRPVFGVGDSTGYLSLSSERYRDAKDEEKPDKGSRY